MTRVDAVTADPQRERATDPPLQWQLLSSIGAGIGAGLAISVLVASAIYRDGWWTPLWPGREWMEPAGALLVAAGLGVIIVGVVVALRLDKQRAGMAAALRAMSRAERRSLWAQVMRNTSVPTTDRAARDTVAQAMSLNRRLPWLHTGLMVGSLGQVLAHSLPVMVAVFGVQVAVFVPGTVWAVGSRRAADVFLREHRYPEDQ